MKTTIITAVGFALLPCWADITGDPDRGKETAVLCSACHQENGAGKDNSGEAESWPRLAGLPAAYLHKQMLDIKNGEREAPSMTAFANMLDEQQIADISAYYAALPIPDIESIEADAALLAHGEKLAMRGDWDRYLPPCVACHGPDNRGAGDIFPPLAGQHAHYLQKQLQLWESGQRRNDVNELMLSIAKRLTPEDIQAVSLYLAAQAAQGAEGEKP